MLSLLTHKDFIHFKRDESLWVIKVAEHYETKAMKMERVKDRVFVGNTPEQAMNKALKFLVAQMLS